MAMLRPVVVLGGARTPFALWARGRKEDGSPGGALKALDPFDLGASALKGALERSSVPADAVEHVVFGNAYHVGAHAVYGGRYAALRAGVPAKVPASTVALACGSGLYAVAAAAREIELGSDLVAASGADSSSLVPKEVFGPSFVDMACGKAIGKTVEDLARDYGVDRAAMDAWALRSHQLAREAQLAGRLAEEIVPTAGVELDDALMTEPSAERFAAAKPARGVEQVTSLNTHAIVDGGSAVILASEKGAQGRRSLGRLLSAETVALEPDRMGLASVPAIRSAVAKAGLKIGDIDLFEINETFAAQALIDVKELGVSESKVNVNGGAIALGHPFAGTGPKQVLELLLELRRRGLKHGAAAICVGGGQGVAAVVEAA
jgi:acetyl-CoA acetyltransferase family protein